MTRVRKGAALSKMLTWSMLMLSLGNCSLLNSKMLLLAIASRSFVEFKSQRDGEDVGDGSYFLSPVRIVNFTDLGKFSNIYIVACFHWSLVIGWLKLFFKKMIGLTRAGLMMFRLKYHSLRWLNVLFLQNCRQSGVFSTINHCEAFCMWCG